MRYLILAGAVTALAVPAAAQDATTAAEAFGAREVVRQISLSPDGTRVAIVSPLDGQASKLVVARLGTDEVRTIMTASGAPDRLDSCHWQTDARLLCRVIVVTGGARDLTSFDRMIAVNADGSDRKIMSAPGSGYAVRDMQRGGDVIDWLAPADDAVLATRDFVPEDANEAIADKLDGLGVERVSLATLKRQLVEAPIADAVEYIADNRGAVRIVGTRKRLSGGYLSPIISYRYRLQNDRKWRPLGDVDFNSGTGFDPHIIDPATNAVYGFERKDGRLALYRVGLDERLAKELVFARADVDVAGIVQIGRGRRVVGATFATDRDQIEFFDPALRKLAASLSKALPKLPLVSFVDADASERRLLLWAGSDTDPGHYYVFDRETKRLDEVLPVRGRLAGVALAPVKAVTYPAADGTPIPAYLTLPVGGAGRALPTIVMPHGGPGARDTWGFDWLAQFFAHRGYAVLQPNFRGSAGYGDAWFQDNGFKSWRIAIGDVTDAGRWLQAQGIAAPGKLAIVGWSYGGYAALQSGVVVPDLFRAIVAIAPVTDLDMLRGEARRFQNFRLVDRFIGQGAHVQDGSPARNASAIIAPVLLFHGDRDMNVGIGESRLMRDRLTAAKRSVELVEFPGLDHQLDDDAARATLLSRTDAFLRAAMESPGR